MPHKHLLFRSEAREKILRGAAAIADAVRVTLDLSAGSAGVGTCPLVVYRTSVPGPDVAVTARTAV